MAPDRSLMGELHEQFLAELNGGRKSKASGSTWKDQGDGRGNALTEEFAFAWDGKSTRGQSIAVSREMITKIREQAASERPMIGLRFYGTDDLKQVDEDWVAVTAADWAEVLAAARRAVAAEEALTEMGSVYPVSQPIAGDYARTDQPPPVINVPVQAEQEGWLPDPGWIREREGRWMSPPPPLHGSYPPDLPPPPHELWPCLVVDTRHDKENNLGADSCGYQIAADGRVTEVPVSSVRYDRGMGYVRLYVNDAVVRSGQLYIDGTLRVTVGPPTLHTS